VSDLAQIRAEDAEEYTQALGQVAAGAWRQIALGERLGVPKALKMTTREWVEQRLGGYIRLTVEERRRAVAELDGEGMGPRAIGRVLGVDPATVLRDQGVANATPSPDGIPDDQQEQSASVADATPEDDGRVVLSERASQQRIDEARELNEAHPDLAAKVLAGDMEPKRAQRIARERDAEQRRLNAAPHAIAQNGIETRIGDFRKELAQIDVGTVDAIITDPPYKPEFWPLYEQLGEQAARLLVPGGVLAVMTGTRLGMLDAVEPLLAISMRRRHRGIYLTPGPRWRDQLERVATGYKPILIYARPDADDLRWINDDIFGSTSDDKRFHHWGQSESGMASLVERLTDPGALVVDPFLGGGTTAVVCRDLGRRFLGCDIDPAAVATARERLE
jgi:SAM-dependent methyltransferase